jgi:transposase
MGGKSSRRLPRVRREQILNAYKAGPDAVVSLFEYLQDQFQGIVDELSSALDELSETNEKLVARVQALEEKIGKDSRNSDKPPSSDPPRRKFSQKPEKHSGRKPGGQKGHEGTTLAMVKHPQQVQIHQLSRCGCCGRSLQQQKSQRYEKRQVFDIPPIEVQVTEHRAEVKRCPRCGELSVAPFPEGVTHRTQYGLRLQAVAVYLKNYGFLSYDRCAQAFADLFGVPLSRGTLVSIDERCARRVAGVVEQIRQQLMREKVVHFDETGLNVNRTLYWLHAAGTKKLTYYYPHRRRGTVASDAIGILPRLKGTAVHDNWQAYMTYNCSHSLCNAHHIRELTNVSEQDGQPWAQQMIGLLLESKEAVQKAKEAGKKRLDPRDLHEYENRYQTIIALGRKANPPPTRAQSPGKRGRLKRSKATNLLDRLAQRQKETLRYLYDFRIPFDNNQAESDVRMMRVQQKISGLFRSYHGALSFCQIRSYISTIRKQHLSVIEAIINAFEKNLTLSDCLQTT